MAGEGDREVLMTRALPVRPRSVLETDVSLPADLLEKARFRARRFTLVFIAISSLAFALAVGNLASSDVIGTETGARIGVWLHGVLLALELALYAVARSSRFSEPTKRTFGSRSSACAWRCNRWA